MSFLRHVQACNRCNSSNFIPFRVDGIRVGLIRPAFAEHLRGWPDIFHVHDNGVDLVVTETGFTERSARVAEILPSMVEQGIITHLHGEQYAATAAGREDGVLLVDRAVVPYFGIRAYGQHLNGYVVEDGSLKLWVGRRSDDRRHYPGKLDNLVAGGLPCDVGLKQNLAKECWEEAGISAETAARACPVGTVTYNIEVEKGLKPDVLYCYDLQLDPGFRPRCTDGEVAEFHLLPVEEVMEIVRESDEFKLNCNLVVIDFLIRHGYLGPEHDDYLELVSGLHPAPLV